MSNFKRPSDASAVRFSNAMFGQVEKSRMISTPVHLTTFNAGDIVPIYCREVLPNESIDFSMDYVVRQTTLLTPTMGNMHVDFYAFFVPNRIVNKSWKAVEGENFNGSWTANKVGLAPLLGAGVSAPVNIPVGSVADYYGFPTQKPIPAEILHQCNDLKFRGYVMIYNEFFRDQNYQPPIPMSTLNVYEGFLEFGDRVKLDGEHNNLVISPNYESDGSFGTGAVQHAIFDASTPVGTNTIGAAASNDVNHNGTYRFIALNSPLKANRIHDYFSSVLPSPQKGATSFAPVSGEIGSLPVYAFNDVRNQLSQENGRVHMGVFGGSAPVTLARYMVLDENDKLGTFSSVSDGAVVPNVEWTPDNLVTGTAEVTGLSFSVDDLRMAASIQQVYETFARGGSRYRSIVASFFGIDADDPFSDIPVCLGHISRDLDLFQTAQTSPSSDGSTPQGNLAAFGYTADNGHLFKSTFVEHGYVHVFAIVRHRNIYSSYLSRDNFRRNMLDFYLPPLANISEQPVYTREINPFGSVDGVFGYQEAWAEYRYEPDTVSGYMRPGVDGSLAHWNYADGFDEFLQICDYEWLKSNSEEVLNRSLASTTATGAPQFKGEFKFIVDKTLPMPTYSVPGLDIL